MTLHLTIVTPTDLVLDRLPVAALRAEDESGCFGMLAGHADLMTTMHETILRWHLADGTAGYCAVSGALLVVTGGCDVRVTAREVLLGDRLEMLAAAVESHRNAETEAMRRVRVDATRLHARAVRSLVAHLAASGPALDMVT